MSAQSVDNPDNYDGSAEETRKPPPGIRGPMFPLSYKDGFNQWVSLRSAYIFNPGISPRYFRASRTNTLVVVQYTGGSG